MFLNPLLSFVLRCVLFIYLLCRDHLDLVWTELLLGSRGVCRFSGVRGAPSGQNRWTEGPFGSGRVHGVTRPRRVLCSGCRDGFRTRGFKENPHPPCVERLFPKGLPRTDAVTV